MSISSTTNRVNYTGNGAVNTYDYTFRIFTENDLKVVVTETATNTETVLSLTTDYTVTGVTDAGGGTIVLVDSGQSWLDAGGDLDIGFTITIRRLVSIIQETDIRNQGDFYPEVHEDAFDYSRMIDQQQQDEIDRSAKLPESVLPSAFDPTLPTDIEQVSRVIITKPTSDGFEMGPSAGEISSAESFAIAADASATASASSASDSAASAVSSAASAASAASQLASAFFTDVVFYTSASSPVALATADNGKLHSFDSSGGPIIVNLPEISGETMPFNMAFLLTVAGNDVTVNRGGATDTIQGGTSKILSVANTGFQAIADTDPTPDTWSILEFGSVGDNTVTRSKVAQGGVASKNINTVTDDYTALTASDDLILVDAISKNITVTLPTAVGDEGREFTVKRIDDDNIKTDTFVDGDVTVGTDNINITSHPFVDLQHIQLTTSGTLPAGLATATDYYVIYVDSDNFKLASSIVNAIADTAVDITAAAGGGTHTVTSQQHTVTVDGDGSETIEGFANITLNVRNDFLKVISDNANFSIKNSHKSPTFQQFTSGSGTYVLPNGAKFIKVRMIGGGGGGVGSGTAAGTAAGNGTNSTFGTSFLIANSGIGGGFNSSGGAGGGASIGAGAIGFTIGGGAGNPGGFQIAQNTASILPGGGGGTSFFGGFGPGGVIGTAGSTATANSGGGGGGGGGANIAGMVSGAGGGSGGYVDAIITSPSASYPYVVGLAGAAGAAGTNGYVGGAGAAGVIVVEEFY